MASEAELRRLDKVRRLAFDKIAKSSELECIIELAASTLRAPMAFISILDSGQAFNVIRFNFPIEQVERAASICNLTISERAIICVPDISSDPRFNDSPLLSLESPAFAYLGAPLFDGEGNALGTVCVLDNRVRDFTIQERQQLEAYASLIVSQFELGQMLAQRKTMMALPDKQQLHRDLAILGGSSNSPMCLCLAEMLSSGSLVALSELRDFEWIEQLLMLICERVTLVVGKLFEVYQLDQSRYAFIVEGGDRLQAARVINALTPELIGVISSDNIQFEPSCKFGIVPFFPNEWQTIERRSNLALRYAHERDLRLAFYDAEYDQMIQRQHRLGNDASNALVRGDFQLLFQPSVNLASKGVDRFEALIRWEHHEFGTVSPTEFIPVFERLRLIQKLTDWVVTSAIDHLAQWRREGIETVISINISPASLRNENLLQCVKRNCHFFGVNPHQLHLEITEGEWVSGNLTVIQQLTSLKKFGLSIHIDDFGSGYSNFGYLPKLPIDGLKIDRSLISGIFRDSRRNRVVCSIVKLAQSLNLEVTAEGIESKDEATLLSAYGCDFGQGYLFSRPMTARNVPNYLKNEQRPHIF
ncbi:sensor domain-containing diguanylate cyclase [Xanthomonas axonopodis]|uniref:sensor domain-containing diguanylate cyclase n=1 Tax=Xanthomonas axonopodis TaxID=53413 RepID=UPI0009971B92|nr:EAL domain-containing protein [Xanthomonas axonopodis]